MRWGSATGRLRSNTASTALKMMALAPMPSVSVTTTTAVNAGAFRSDRIAYRRSIARRSEAIAHLPDVIAGGSAHATETRSASRRGQPRLADWISRASVSACSGSAASARARAAS